MWVGVLETPVFFRPLIGHGGVPILEKILHWVPWTQTPTWGVAWGRCIWGDVLRRCTIEQKETLARNMVTDESQATGSTGAGPALQRCPQLRPRGCPCFQFLYHPVIGCRKSPRRSLWQRAVPSGGYSCPPATDVSSSWGTNA